MGSLVMKVPAEGAVYLNDVKMVLHTPTQGGSKFKITLTPQNGEWKRTYDVHSDKSTVIEDGDVMTEIPPVKVQVALGSRTSLLKVAIDAPDEVIVLREQLYLNSRDRDDYYHFSRTAKQKLRGIFCGNMSLRDAADMVYRSATVTHESGNRRYENLIFRVKGQVVLDVTQV